MSNIWTAASEGDFARVRELVEAGTSPSGPDENSYTPLHAAASWNHPDILEYLIREKGADPNTLDDDGETCLFVVESVAVARQCVDLGVDPLIRNHEGLTAAQSLQEDFPHVSLYLRSITGEASSSTTAALRTEEDDEGGVELDLMTDDLLAKVREIMERQDTMTGEELDAELRTVVEEAVTRQVETGRAIGESETAATGTAAGVTRPAPADSDVDSPPKRQREEAGRMEHPDGNPFAARDAERERNSMLGQMEARAIAQNPSVAREYGVSNIPPAQPANANGANKRTRVEETDEDDDLELDAQPKKKLVVDVVPKNGSSAPAPAAVYSSDAVLIDDEDDDEDEHMSDQPLPNTDAQEGSGDEENSENSEEDDSDSDGSDSQDESSVTDQVDKSEVQAQEEQDEGSSSSDSEEDDDDDDDEDSDDSSSALSSVDGSKATSPPPVPQVIIDVANTTASTSDGPAQVSPVKPSQPEDKKPRKRNKGGEVRRLRTPTPPPPPRKAKTFRFDISLASKGDAPEFDITKMAVDAGFLEPERTNESPVKKPSLGPDGLPNGPPPKKKRKRKIVGRYGGYDTSDPFVDDTEIGLYEPAVYHRPKRDGYFVATGNVELYTRRRKNADTTKENDDAARASSTKPKLSSRDDKLPKASSVPAFGSSSGAAGSKGGSSSDKPDKPKRAEGEFDPVLRKALDDFQALVKSTPFAVQGKLPAEIRPQIAPVGLLAIEKEQYDEQFFKEVMKMLPYNLFTVRKLIKKEVFPRRVEQLRLSQDAWIEDIEKGIKETLPDQLEDYEKAVKEWEEEQDKLKRADMARAASASVGPADDAAKKDGGSSKAASPAAGDSTKDGEQAKEGDASKPKADIDAADAVVMRPKPKWKFRFSEDMRTAVFNIHAAEEEISRLTLEKEELDRKKGEKPLPKGKGHSAANAIKALYARLVDLWPPELMDSNRLSREVSIAKTKVRKQQDRE